jgi:hypothetical protein
MSSSSSPFAETDYDVIASLARDDPAPLVALMKPANLDDYADDAVTASCIDSGMSGAEIAAACCPKITAAMIAEDCVTTGLLAGFLHSDLPLARTRFAEAAATSSGKARLAKPRLLAIRRLHVVSLTARRDPFHGVADFKTFVDALAAAQPAPKYPLGGDRKSLRHAYGNLVLDLVKFGHHRRARILIEAGVITKRMVRELTQLGEVSLVLTAAVVAGRHIVQDSSLAEATISRLADQTTLIAAAGLENPTIFTTLLGLYAQHKTEDTAARRKLLHYLATKAVRARRSAQFSAIVGAFPSSQIFLSEEDVADLYAVADSGWFAGVLATHGYLPPDSVFVGAARGGDAQKVGRLAILVSGWVPEEALKILKRTSPVAAAPLAAAAERLGSISVSRGNQLLKPSEDPPSPAPQPVDTSAADAEAYSADSAESPDGAEKSRPSPGSGDAVAGEGCCGSAPAPAGCTCSHVCPSSPCACGASE